MSRSRYGDGAARRKLRAEVAALGLPCHLCGRAIDYSLPAGHPWSYELDEIVPASRWREGGYPSLTACVTDRANVAPAHRECNRRRGNAPLGVPAPPASALPLPVSREW
jgi:hypothetical protein